MTAGPANLADAKALADAGKLLEARDAYNAALITGELTQDEIRATKFEMAKLNDKAGAGGWSARDSQLDVRQRQADPFSATWPAPAAATRRTVEQK